jgi:hypothetical protein
MSFTIGTGLKWTVGQQMLIAYDANNTMTGTVISYNTGTGALSVTLTASTGSGSYGSWVINILGAPGQAGTDGTSGTTGSAGTSGKDGTNGTAGKDGTNGTAGKDGTNGTAGTSGTNGTAGSGGTSGTSGKDGTFFGSAGTSGSSGTSGTSGTSGSGGTSGAQGTPGTNGTSGTRGSAGSAGTSGVNGTNGTAGTSGTTGTTGSAGTSGKDGTNGTAGTSGTNANLIVQQTGQTAVTGVAKVVFNGAGVTNNGSGQVTVDINSGGSSLTVVSGSTTITSVSQITLASSLNVTNQGAGAITLSSLGSAGGGTGSSGSSGTSGSSGKDGTMGTSGSSGKDGTGGTSGTSSVGTSGTSGSAGSPGTSGLNGSYGSSGTSGQNGSAGTSGTGVTLSLNDAGNTTLSDIKAVTFGSGFTLSSGGTYSASITVSGYGGSAVPGTVSSSAQIVGFDLFAVTTGSNKFFSTQAINGNVNITGSLRMTGLLTASLPTDYVWVGDADGLSAMVHKNTLTGSSGGGTGTGFPYVGRADISGSLVLTGSLVVTGSITASSFYTNTAGIPEIASPSTLRLTAVNTVHVTTSSLRLASFTDAQTSSLTATNGDLIYNTTSNKFWGYAGGAWVALH